jgi:3-hydroxy-3-methylglutaryl CoA synthase
MRSKVILHIKVSKAIATVVAMYVTETMHNITEQRWQRFAKTDNTRDLTNQKHQQDLVFTLSFSFYHYTSHLQTSVKWNKRK